MKNPYIDYWAELRNKLNSKPELKNTILTCYRPTGNYFVDCINQGITPNFIFGQVTQGIEPPIVQHYTRKIKYK